MREATSWENFFQRCFLFLLLEIICFILMVCMSDHDNSDESVANLSTDVLSNGRQRRQLNQFSLFGAFSRLHVCNVTVINKSFSCPS